jgi:outer membrane protein assembly factor BamB
MLRPESARFRRAVTLTRVLAACVAALAALPPASARAEDWTRYGHDAQRSNFAPSPTGITAANVAGLRRVVLNVEGIVDSSPLYLGALATVAGVRDTFIVETSYGKVLALDASTGAVLWSYVPPGLEKWSGSFQITESTPLVDPNRRSLYVAVPDGFVHKLSLYDGSEIGGGWPVRITLAPRTEKLGSLNMSKGRLVALAGGNAGDNFPYQGHLVTIDPGSGRITGVFYGLCSNQKTISGPTRCPSSGSSMWSRSGAVVEPRSGRLLVTTGQGRFNGRTNWGSSLLELSPDGRQLLQNFTPVNFVELLHRDTDLGSTGPAIFAYRGGRFAIQGGKDAIIRLLDLRRLNGRTGKPGVRSGGNLQAIRFAPTAGHGIFSTSAVAQENGRVTLFVANGDATAAFTVTGRTPRLRYLWRRPIAGTSPILAGGLLYVYDYVLGALNVYDPRTGGRFASLPAEKGHWNTPVIADGRILLGEGNANRRFTVGTMSLYLPPGG